MSNPQSRTETNACMHACLCSAHSLYLYNTLSPPQEMVPPKVGQVFPHQVTLNSDRPSHVYPQANLIQTIPHGDRPSSTLLGWLCHILHKCLETTVMILNTNAVVLFKKPGIFIGDRRKTNSVLARIINKCNMLIQNGFTWSLICVMCFIDSRTL